MTQTRATGWAVMAACLRVGCARMSTLMRVAVLAGLASTLAVTPASARRGAGEEDSSLVEFGPAPAVASAVAAPIVRDQLAEAPRSRFVEIRVDDVLAAVGSPQVDLELFPGVVLPLESDGAARPGAGDSLTWSGLAESGDYATLTFVGGQVIGTAAVGGTVYDIQPVAGDTHLIIEEGHRTWREAGPAVPPDSVNGGDVEPGPDVLTGPNAEVTPLIRVLNVYDTAARTYYGSDAAAQNQMMSYVNETNAAFDRSGANLSLQLAAAEYVDYAGSTDVTSGLLGRLSNTHDGYLDAVHRDRDRLNADLVALITGPRTTPLCGIAWIVYPGARGDIGFSVSAADCGSLIYAHELGHNLGAGHGMGNGDGAFPYSNGYCSEADDVRTIMAYFDWSNCVVHDQVAYFSSPTRLYQGHATGSPTQDNARTLSELAPTVAGFRPGPPQPDARIRRGTGPTVGDNIYCRPDQSGSICIAYPGPGETRNWWCSPSCAQATQTGSAAGGRSVTYYISIQNDALVAGGVRLRGQPSSSRFAVAYRNPAGVNITRRVTTGTYTTPVLAPQGTHQIKVTVTVSRTAPRGASLARTLRAASVTQPTITDNVTFVTRRS